MKRQEEEQKELEQENVNVRKTYLDKLEAEHQAERDAKEAKLDEELAPTKERAKRQWLYDHPVKSAADVNNHACPLLKTNIAVDRREQLIQNEIAAQSSRMGNVA